MADQLQIGDRVGIKDGADFLHWSRFGTVTGLPDALSGGAAGYAVLEDSEAESVHMHADLLVRLGAPGEAGAPGEWTAQSFPVDGEAPGPVMYFRNGADVLEFAMQFSDAGLSDEKLKVHAPASATAEEHAGLRNAGIALV